MAHSLAEIEDDALRLPPEDRARLAVHLLASLEETVLLPPRIVARRAQSHAALASNCLMLAVRVAKRLIFTHIWGF